ncbi:MAG: sphR [Acidobacteria bacterium]|nr:sphR [Acidobacteriota bacterium]
MPSTDTAAPTQRYRALIVEDDPAIRRLVERLLIRQGIDVDTAADGRIAIDKLANGDYSVIILDLMVPEVTGFDVIEHVKSQGITTPVAVVSAVSQQSLTRLDLDVVKLVMMKPFDVDEFTKAILQLCAEERPETVS